MADPIKIVITADVNNAISNIDKLNTKLASVDDVVSDVIKGSANLDDALDKLGKQGLLSVNSLQQSINDFKNAFNNATDPGDIKKFGDALKVLQQRQQSLIDTGLGVADASSKISKSHEVTARSTQRLSASFLGLSKIFDVLPPELQHLTHGFDQVVQSYEQVTHGTETTKQAISKFAGVLGQAGIGLGIGLAVGFLSTYIQKLLEASEASKKAAEVQEQLKKAFESIAGGAAKEQTEVISLIAVLKNETETRERRLAAIKELQKIQPEIFSGLKLEGDAVVGLDNAYKSYIENLKTVITAKLIQAEIEQKITELLKLQGIAATKSQIEAANGLKKINEQLSKGVLKEGVQIPTLGDKFAADREKKIKTFEEEINGLAERLEEFSKGIKVDVPDLKKGTDKINTDLQNRLNIIKEFTAKFASIKDPFPDFFTKNLPLGKVEDKALRAALENAFKVLSEAAKDLFNTQKIDPGTIPLEIHFKPEIVGKSALVRLIEDKFGEIKKEVEDAVNKGIFEVPLDFKLPSEGDGQALKVAEDLVNNLAKSIEGLSGQRKAILNFDFDVSKLNAATAEQVIINAENEINRFASNVPLKLKVNADLSVTATVDKERVIKELNTQINDIVAGIATDSFANLGQAIGDALSGEGVGDAFKQFGNIIAKGLEAVGKALIAAGVKMALAKAALSKIALSPALSIAAGIALIALSRLLQNSIATARQMGGNVKEGLRYIVNEAGPEIFKPNQGEPSWLKGRNTLFTPSVSGTVIPAWQAKLFAAQNNMPAFQFGGLVSGPTFGLLGEGGNISRSNPEVIAPLDSLKSLLFNPNIGIQNNLSVKLRVRDIILGSARENRSQRRNT